MQHCSVAIGHIPPAIGNSCHLLSGYLYPPMMLPPNTLEGCCISQVFSKAQGREQQQGRPLLTKCSMCTAQPSVHRVLQVPGLPGVGHPSRCERGRPRAGDGRYIVWQHGPHRHAQPRLAAGRARRQRRHLRSAGEAWARRSMGAVARQRCGCYVGICKEPAARAMSRWYGVCTLHGFT